MYLGVLPYLRPAPRHVTSVVRVALPGLVAAILVGCGGGSDETANLEALVRRQYPNRTVTCAKSDLTYGGDHAYSCRVGGKRFCFAKVDDELLPLWDERALRPGERGYDSSFGVTVKTGPSC